MIEAGVIDKTVMVFGQMNEPPGVRLRVGLTALTMAEYFRDQGRDVLIFIDNIFRFVMSGSEVSALLGRMPSAVGYQPTLAFEMGQLQERITSTRRRGEVLMVIQRPGGEILVHTKAFYPPEAYRLLTGGIGWEETAWDALHREIEEETGLPVHSATWWGLITYTLYPSEAGRDQGIPFVSFVFHVYTEGEPRAADWAERIAAFRWISPEALPEIARRLESLDAPWRGWGAFRAIGHRFVWEHHREHLLLRP